MYESLRSMSKSRVFVSAQPGRGIKGGMRSMKTWRMLSSLKKCANKGSGFMPSNRSQTLGNDQILFISLIVHTWSSQFHN